MNRREFLIGSTAGAGLLATGCVSSPSDKKASIESSSEGSLKLLPYPQQIQNQTGSLRLGPPSFERSGPGSRTVEVAAESLVQFLPKTGQAIPIRLGSIEEGYNSKWLEVSDREFLETATSTEASVILIKPQGITIVGKSRWGMLYGAQTINQLAEQARRSNEFAIPACQIRDWPDMRWRCLSPTLTWYSGWNRLEGYDLCNWSEGEWKWLADWSMLHKCNGWAVCMYGYWPFTLPGYEEETLDLDSYHFNPETNKKELRRFTHRNIKREFYPEVIRYANERGVKVYAYIGKNSFNGRAFRDKRDIYAGGAAEMLPFAPGVDKYWDRFIGRILDLGFNGFVFEDPEANHVPNQNEQCYQAFWAPWASKYGYSTVKETNRNNPPLGVHVEYYTWLFREFDAKIQKHGKRLGMEPEIYLISHILLARIISESKTAEERQYWFNLVDEKHGKKIPFIIGEWSETLYVEIFGKERVSSLGGRGGSCTNAMRRIASVNNNWLHGGMGGDLAYERDCQVRIHQAGGFGAMGYIFEWTNTEVFGYLAAQHLWRNAGIPGVSNENQVDILHYSYRLYYGDKAGTLAARAMDEGSHVNDAMVLEGVYGSQYPTTGKPLHRDYQYLVVLADHAESLAQEAYISYTGKEPELYKANYNQDDFHWNGFDAEADKLFKSERLRLLWISTRRSAEMCRAALAHRLTQRLIAEGASIGSILEQMDKSIHHARQNERIYQLNYDDDYDWTDGLCSKVTAKLESIKERFLADNSGETRVVKEWNFTSGSDSLGWTQFHDTTAPAIQNGLLQVQSTGSDPFLMYSGPLQIPANKAHHFLTIEMASNRAGAVQIFWAASPTGAASQFSEEKSVLIQIPAQPKINSYRVQLKWDGILSGFRIDFPSQSAIQIRSIQLAGLLPGSATQPLELSKPVAATVRSSAEPPVLHIPWEPQTDILPFHGIKLLPGLYLSTYIGFVGKDDYFRVGVVYTVQVQKNDQWQTIFRRGLHRRMTGWHKVEIPIPPEFLTGKKLRIRFITDSYSRAQERTAPSWKWALWGEPRLIQIGSLGFRETVCDFFQKADGAAAYVRLDNDGRERPFDGLGEDSTGATFKRLGPDKMGRKLIALMAEKKELQWASGFLKWSGSAPSQGSYTSFLGETDSHWSYGGQPEVGWETEPLTSRKDSALVFIGSTDFQPAKAEISCEGVGNLSFQTTIREDGFWHENGLKLRYLHSAEIPNRGISGIYILEVPGGRIQPGKPLRLSMRIPEKRGWVMCHGYADVINLLRDPFPCPRPERPSLMAFTPHLNDQFGVTMGEFSLDL